MNETGVRNLLNATIERAIHDYRELKRKKALRTKEPILLYKVSGEKQNLINFFQPNGAADRLLRVLDSPFSGATVRRAIGYKEVAK